MKNTLTEDDLNKIFEAINILQEYDLDTSSVSMHLSHKLASQPQTAPCKKCGHLRSEHRRNPYIANVWYCTNLNESCGCGEYIPDID